MTMAGCSSVRAGALVLLALAGSGCLAVYLPDRDLTAAAPGLNARVLEVRAEPFLRTSLAIEGEPGTRLLGVTASRQQDRCEAAPASLQSVDGRALALPAPADGPWRLEVYLPEPAQLSGAPSWLAIAFDRGEASAGAAPGCLTVPLVAPEITWRRQRAWGSGGFVRGQNATHSAAGSGLLLMLGGWWRHSGEGPVGMSVELAFTAGWCGDFIACEEARVIGLTPALAGQLRLLRTRRLLLEAEFAGEVTTAFSTGSNSLWLLATPRFSLRAWRTGPRLLGFTPDLRVGALGVELSYGYRFARADGRAGQAPVIGLGLVLQPAL
jgi:hypothetical protein